MRRFFESLAGTGLFGAFAGVHVASRVIEAQALRRVLFYEQVLAIARHDGSDCGAGMPTLSCHTSHYG
jgi:hypothetical protein